MASSGALGDEAFGSGRGHEGIVPLAGAATTRDTWQFSEQHPKDDMRSARSDKLFLRGSVGDRTQRMAVCNQMRQPPVRVRTQGAGKTATAESQILLARNLSLCRSACESGMLKCRSVQLKREDYIDTWRSNKEQKDVRLGTYLFA
jgi:hypothetical protein